MTLSRFISREKPLTQATSNDTRPRYEDCCLSLVSVNFEAKLRQQDPPSSCCLYLSVLPCWLPAGGSEMGDGKIK